MNSHDIDEIKAELTAIRKLLEDRLPAPKKSEASRSAYEDKDFLAIYPD